MKILQDRKGNVDIIVILTYIAIALAFGVLIYSYTQSFVSTDYYNAKKDSAVLGLSRNDLPKLQGDFHGEFPRDPESEYRFTDREIVVKKGDVTVKYIYTHDENAMFKPVIEEGDKIVINH